MSHAVPSDAVALAHAGVWGHWVAEPLVIVGLLAALVAHQRGNLRTARLPGRSTGTSTTLFATGLLAVAVALASPLDGLADELASAHMVQHVLLVGVAPPLLVLSRPMAALLAGSPSAVRHSAHRCMRRMPLSHPTHRARSAIAAWGLHTAALWFWHASAPYELAVEQPVVHAVEHGTFLATALLFWSTVLAPLTYHRRRTDAGGAALLVFATLLQSVFLAALLTFATQPWYDVYLDTTRAHGLDPLADQHLAGVIMWVPAGFVYVIAGLALLQAWMRGPERAPRPRDGNWHVGAAPPHPPELTRPRR